MKPNLKIVKKPDLSKIGKIELTQADSNQLKQRVALLEKKNISISELQVESQLLNLELGQFLKEIVQKHNVPHIEGAKWDFNKDNGTLTLQDFPVDPNKKPV